MPIAPLQLAD